ncbi:unnamed protein product [Macrosiphum euphorbiae]|uniref:MADF domain-containing protein n=1 Tax=Macrosiphum euphorbiae TaxID=13131 RepID=A0AAV0XUR7_9HEMI|nr:unnamed protein product [Macrosiphum euphorbiae]
MVFDTIEFLKHYEEHPCLWDKCLPHFKNRQKRNVAEEKLLPISGLSNIKELRSEIRTDIYKPKLNWFSYADSFLRKNVEQEIETESNVVSYKFIVTFINIIIIACI